MIRLLGMTPGWLDGPIRLEQLDPAVWFLWNQVMDRPATTALAPSAWFTLEDAS